MNYSRSPLLYAKYQSPIGDILLIASKQYAHVVKVINNRNISELLLNLQNQSKYPSFNFIKKSYISHRYFREIICQLEEYFKAKRKKFEIAIDWNLGTSFQRKVWKSLLEIPYGSQISYKELAIKLEVKSNQAIGQANKRNYMQIIIPCHRVLNIKNKIIGYESGINIKKWLLHHEVQNNL